MGPEGGVTVGDAISYDSINGNYVEGIMSAGYANTLKTPQLQVDEYGHVVSATPIVTHINLVGKVVDGTQKTIERYDFYNNLISSEEYLSQFGAEVFNDYENNHAIGTCSHAEGSLTIAEGHFSHAEGDTTDAVGNSSHAEGYFTTAFGDNSHAEGYGTIAASPQQHVQGRFNIEDPENLYAHIVGNGVDLDEEHYYETGEQVVKRSNAHTIDWDGNGWFAGSVYVGGTSQDDFTIEKLATIDESAVPLQIAGLAKANVTDLPAHIILPNGYIETNSTWSSGFMEYGNGLFVTCLAREVAGFMDVFFIKEPTDDEWTIVPSTEYAFPNGIIYGANKFVAAVYDSEGNTHIVYSDNGTNWHQGAVQYSPSTGGFVDAEFISYVNDTFVAYSPFSFNFVYTSKDGINWTEIPTSVNNSAQLYIQSIAYGNGVFIAANYEYPSIYVSTDLKTWEEILLNQSICEVTYGENGFIGISWDNEIYYSSDGREWFSAYTTSDPNTYFCYIMYRHGKYIALAETYNGVKIYYSDFGNSGWISGQLYPGCYPTLLCRSDYVCVLWSFADDNNKIPSMVSYDGIHWSNVLGIPAVKTINGKKPDANGNVSINMNMNIDTSQFATMKHLDEAGLTTYIDGNMVVRSMGDLNEELWPNYYIAHAHNDKIGVILYESMAGPRMIMRYEGHALLPIALPVDQDWCDVAYGNNKFIMVDTTGNYLLQSVDGENWEEMESPLAVEYFYTDPNAHIQFVHDRFILYSYGAEGISGYYYDNSETWTPFITDPLWEPQRFDYLNGQFIMNDTAGHLYQSQDNSLTKWKYIGILPNSLIDYVVVNNQIFTIEITREDTTLYRSFDGYSWEANKILVSGSISSMHYLNGIYIFGNSLSYSTNLIDWKSSYQDYYLIYDNGLSVTPIDFMYINNGYVAVPPAQFPSYPGDYHALGIWGLQEDGTIDRSYKTIKSVVTGTPIYNAYYDADGTYVIYDMNDNDIAAIKSGTEIIIIPDETGESNYTAGLLISSMLINTDDEPYQFAPITFQNGGGIPDNQIDAGVPIKVRWNGVANIWTSDLISGQNNTLQGTDIKYNNTNTSLAATNVQQAIDKLYTKIPQVIIREW